MESCFLRNLLQSNIRRAQWRKEPKENDKIVTDEKMSASEAVLSLNYITIVVSTYVSIWAVYHDLLILNTGITFSMSVTPTFFNHCGSRCHYGFVRHKRYSGP